MAIVFMLLGTLGGLAFTVLTFWYGNAKSESGQVRPEAFPIITGILLSGFVFFIGTWLSDREERTRR